MSKIILINTTLLLLIHSNVLKAEVIQFLNWWDYLPKEVNDDLTKKNIKFRMLEYRSNEVALSKMLNSRNKFDVAIVSNWVIEILNEANLIDNQLLSGLISQRNYSKYLLPKDINCVPLLWAASVYVHSNEEKSSVKSIHDLIRLKNEKKKIGIIDDAKEFYYAIKVDSKLKNCKNKIRNECRELQELKPTDFISSVAESINRISGGYGWSGELSLALKSSQNFSFALPRGDVVLGTDYVCALNKKDSNKKKVLHFIKTLTSNKNIEHYTKSSQYFSPYEEHNYKYLFPKTKELYRNVLKKINKGEFLRIQHSESAEKINSLWRAVRYNK